MRGRRYVSTAVREALALGAAAFLVGLSGAMAPGPYLTVTITRTLRQGRLSALLMLVGHAVLEGVLLIGFAFGLQHFLTRPTVAAVLGVLGGAVLLWMGLSLLRGAYTGSIRLETDADVGAALPRFGPVLHGAVMSVSSPYWTLWWATIGVKLAADGLAIGPLGVAAFFVGHQLADLVWYSAVISAVSAGKRLLSDRVYRIIIGGCAVFLLYLGAQFALESLL
jgi:threonine/homoserine/homoserine lactone efflux protein